MPKKKRQPQELYGCTMRGVSLNNNRADINQELVVKANSFEDASKKALLKAYDLSGDKYAWTVSTVRRGVMEQLTLAQALAGDVFTEDIPQVA
jgi:hypothetical protein